MAFRYRDLMEREEEYQRGVREREGGRKVVFSRQYSEATRRRHEQLIRRILEDFDLEETKTKYRTSNACEIRRDGRSLADFRFRSELTRMMGTDVIRLSDQGWSVRFQNCLRHDYERQLEEQMHSLAEAERQRLHRLRVEGVIQDSSGKASDDLMKRAFSRPMSRCSSRRQSQRSRQVSTIHDAFYPAAWKTFPEPTPVFSDEDLNQRERALSARRKNKAYRPPDLSVTMMAGSDREGEEETDDGPHAPESTGSQSHEAEIQLPVMTSEERRQKRFKRLPPHVARLYDEETVEGLYHWAQRLVGRPRVQEPEESSKLKMQDYN